MKKLVVLLLVFLLMPVMVMADEPDSDETTTTTSSNIQSPDTGVEDYFLTLAVVSVSLGTVLYILNKKNVFQEI